MHQVLEFCRFLSSHEMKFHSLSPLSSSFYAAYGDQNHILLLCKVEPLLNQQSPYFSRTAFERTMTHMWFTVFCQHFSAVHSSKVRLQSSALGTENGINSHISSVFSGYKLITLMGKLLLKFSKKLDQENKRLLPEELNLCDMWSC